MCAFGARCCIRATALPWLLFVYYLLFVHPRVWVNRHKKLWAFECIAEYFNAEMNVTMTDCHSTLDPHRMPRQDAKKLALSRRTGLFIDPRILILLLTSAHVFNRLAPLKLFSSAGHRASWRLASLHLSKP